MAGQGFASRVAASLLSDANCADHVAVETKEYATFARNLTSGKTRFEASQQWPIDASKQTNEFVDVITGI
jgi:predicted O-linked N-acetylglucosamine transferase (SPINDLY family)